MWNNKGGNKSFSGDMGGGYVNGEGNSSQTERISRVRTLVPCTVNQILSASQDNDKFVCDGIPLDQICIVGKILQADETNTRVDYLFDDGTGKSIRIRQFLDRADDNPDERTTPILEVGSYVEMFGQVRMYNEEINVIAFRLNSLKSLNEVTCHMARVLATKKHYELSGETVLASTSKPSVPLVSSPSINSSMMMDQSNNQFSDVERQVDKVIRSCEKDEGIAVDDIYQKLSSMSQKLIKEALDFLSNEGHIYTTIDDDHYKSTDC